jgi:subtilase family serine protease
LQEATGGGVSSVYPLPSFQTNLSGAASTQFRNVPDVAFPANDDAIYYSGGWILVNGTSWGSPLYAAMLSEVYEYCTTGFDNAAALPYDVYGLRHGAFLDVTSGNNQYAGTSPFYSAQAGYDNATGIGVPYGLPFAQTLCPNRVPSASARMTASVAAVATRRSAQAFVANATPRAAGLVDRGERLASASTLIQIVLQPSASVARDEQQAIATLEAAGLTIVKTFSNHLVIDAQGSTANIEQVFATKLHDVDQGSYGTRYMPVTSITVPASLAPFVAGVTLDNVVIMAHPR